jgi:hypothetical protein
VTLSITTLAPTLLLTSVDRVRAAGLVFPTADEAEIERLIREASAAIGSYCNRTFARESLTETCPGYGDIHLALSRTPVIAVTAVTADGNVITDYSIADKDQGLLYRRGGWGWTVQSYIGLGGPGGQFQDSRLFSLGTPLPRQEEPQMSVDYTGGYILPSQWRFNVDTLSAAAGDSSFNDSAGRFPASIKAGDVVEAIGWSGAGNNGRHLVSGTPTASKILTTSTLTTEAAAAGRTLLFQPPPDCRPFDEVERAAFETVKSWYQGRARDSAVVERQAASTRVRFGETENARLLGLPVACIGLLRAWRRDS